MHPEIIQLLLVPGSLARVLLNMHSKYRQGHALEGACALVALQSSAKQQHQHQQETAHPGLCLVRINKVHSSGGNYELEVAGGGPELEASQADDTILRQPSMNGNAPPTTEPAAAAAAGAAGSNHSAGILNTSACRISIDQVVSIGLQELPPQQAALICTLLAPRLALRGELPDQEKVRKKACQLRGTLMAAAARWQGRAVTKKEAHALEDWNQNTKAWLYENWSRLQEEQASAIAKVMAAAPTLAPTSLHKAIAGWVATQASQPPRSSEGAGCKPLVQLPATVLRCTASLMPPQASTAAQPKLLTPPSRPNPRPPSISFSIKKQGSQAATHASRAPPPARLSAQSTQAIIVAVASSKTAPGVPGPAPATQGQQQKLTRRQRKRERKQERKEQVRQQHMAVVQEAATRTSQARQQAPAGQAWQGPGGYGGPARPPAAWYAPGYAPQYQPPAAPAYPASTARYASQCQYTGAQQGPAVQYTNRYQMPASCTPAYPRPEDCTASRQQPQQGGFTFTGVGAAVAQDVSSNNLQRAASGSVPPGVDTPGTAVELSTAGGSNGVERKRGRSRSPSPDPRSR